MIDETGLQARETIGLVESMSGTLNDSALFVKDREGRYPGMHQGTPGLPPSPNAGRADSRI